MSTILLNRDDKLPPPPPPDEELEYPASYPQQPASFPPPSSASSLDSPFPATPTTPLTPSSISSDPKPKKSNPLNDLVDTEKSYVDQLAGIIRKIAGAWSRSNLPPPDLDSMFRSIEGVYKANRSLHSKLKEIGTNPSSPKALGDLLMRWIDDLEAPYSTYCSKYLFGFDHWDPVQSNIKLGPILASFSASNPPPPSQSAESLWTLDSLFLLPKGRLKYYKKLYGRLLKSTAPGRSDHRLLVGAVEKLDRLMGTLEQRQSLRVGSRSPLTSPVSTTINMEPEDEVVIDMRTQSMHASIEQAPSASLQTIDGDPTVNNESSSARDSSLSEGLSRDTVSTSTSRASLGTMSMPISDLERRLSTQRTLDIFTMTPKSVRLQMVPPSLTFTREMRCSLDLVVRFTPRTTGTQVIHQQGHIFLLSDLFLVCERMTPEERVLAGPNGPDMWLCYPPLAGKVLRAAELPGQDNAIQVHIMRKETLILQLESPQARNALMSDFRECIEFASSVGPISKQAPPPVPPLPGLVGLPKSPSQPISPSRSLPSSAFPSPAGTRTSSPPSGPDSIVSRATSPSSARSSEAGGSIADQLAKLALPPGPSPPQAPQQLPPIRDLPPDRGAFQVPPSIGPGQILPPTRSTSMSSQTSYASAYGAPQYPPHGGLPGHSGPPPPPQRLQQPPFPMYKQALPRGPLGNGPLPPRPPSEPSYQDNMIRKSPSTRSLTSQLQAEPPRSAPPLPNIPPGVFPPNTMNFNANHMMGNGLNGLNGSNVALHAPQPRPLLPSAQFNRAMSTAEQSFAEPSPPNSPVAEMSSLPTGPVTLSVRATMKCKVFLKQQHAQWKSLGAANLKLYREDPTNVKQLVVEADDKHHTPLISTLVLTDGVERVGKTGVAIEISDKGARTGIVYMLQLRNEKSAGGLFNELIQGSDRAK